MTSSHPSPESGPPEPGVVPFPPDLVQQYREAWYWRQRTLPQVLDAAAENFADAPFVSDAVRSLSFRELARSSCRCASWLASHGVRPGSNVVLYLPNSVAWVEAYFGVMRAGARPVLVLSSHGRIEVTHVARKAEAVAIVTTGRVGTVDYAAVARQVAEQVPGLTVLEVAWHQEPPWHQVPDPDPASLPEVSPGSVAVLQLSGGTTGNPKLIPRLHEEYDYCSRAAAEISDLRRGDVMAVVLPAAHNFALSSPGLHGALAVGARVVMAPDPSPATGFALLEQQAVTHLALVPPLLLTWMNSLQAEESTHTALRIVWVGGSKLSRAIAERVEGTLRCRLQQVFGMAEGLCNYTRLDDDEETVVATQGRPLSPADEVRVVDDRGLPVPDGVEGHLQTRGPYTIRGYYRAPEHNARCFTEDGFYVSGDLVTQDSRGYLTVTGRVNDIINRGGEKVAPETVENALLGIPEVHDASVVGVPDDRWGERIVAYVILRETLAEAERPTPRQLIMQVRRSGIAAFAVPDEIQVVDEFPLTAVGKVSKQQQR